MPTLLRSMRFAVVSLVAVALTTLSVNVGTARANVHANATAAVETVGAPAKAAYIPLYTSDVMVLVVPHQRKTPKNGTVLAAARPVVKLVGAQCLPTGVMWGLLVATATKVKGQRKITATMSPPFSIECGDTSTQVVRYSQNLGGAVRTPGTASRIMGVNATLSGAMQWLVTERTNGEVTRQYIVYAPVRATTY